MADLLTKVVMKNISTKALNKTYKKEEYIRVENINSNEEDILKRILYKGSKKPILDNLKDDKNRMEKIDFKSLNYLNHNLVSNKNVSKNINNKQSKNMISLKDLAR
ncbi:hypothetical protein GCM10008904_29510 [Paraclostridium ghonii]|uniref:Uncharacterized protein n=1 Tax=Paraclostridium ghonii TaxID=29358 RepID=A0ABU0MXL1_9FIRM|nr:hypothetical protein [Paeniclostridium ghonii]MCM0166212.1 hypothetical protein [Paeniclostridium ghonii]MDQ0555645.1 hypothetical protein [Paeniclostridium ghonii]